MKRSTFIVPWKEGLHLRPATKIAKQAMAFESSIRIKANKRLADARSLFSILLLAASFGAALDLEVTGPDEEEAIAAIAEVFHDKM
jgi:phosphotransferase system HPr (HPr) family protein